MDKRDLVRGVFSNGKERGKGSYWYGEERPFGGITHGIISIY